MLTGQQTPSVGEAVVVALCGRPDTGFFNKVTLGVPTGNHAHRLSGGAAPWSFILTEVKDADRTGRT
ncbi:hypothetical protein GCM10010433_27060 [Streptomyces pulveraceus]